MTSEKSMLFRKVTAIIRGDALEKVEHDCRNWGCPASA